MMKLPMAFATLALASAAQSPTFAASSNDPLVDNMLSTPMGRAAFVADKQALALPAARAEFVRMENALDKPACKASLANYATTATSVVSLGMPGGASPRAGEAERKLMIEQVLPAQSAAVEAGCGASVNQIVRHRALKATRALN